MTSRTILPYALYISVLFIGAKAFSKSAIHISNDETKISFGFTRKKNILLSMTQTTKNKESSSQSDLFGFLNAKFEEFSQPFLGKKPKYEQKRSETDALIDAAKEILNTAVETKNEDPELVYQAMVDLEKLMRIKVKEEPETVVAKDMLDKLNGEWRLIFTTGTKETQQRFGSKINYFPLKAVQSFSTLEEPMRIQNGIYLGNFALIKFFGDFEFDLNRRKLEFDFDKINILGLGIDLGTGKAAQIGAATGLGSENNKKLVESKKKPFFNWISADASIAIARGGGGGLALWKRVLNE